eukprot:SAG31_NODE_316_length_17841_cov_33.716154_5_plen_186_part_00
MATEAAKQTNLLKKKNDPKQTNWAYGTHSHSEQMHSTYGDDFVEKIGARGSNADAAAKMLAVKNNPKATNWDYGPGTSAETVGVSSTSRAAFQGEPGAMSQLPVETVADLRCDDTLPLHGCDLRMLCNLRLCYASSSHFKPGYVSDMSPFMKTTAKDLVGQKGPPASLSVAVKAGDFLLLPQAEA